MKILWAKNEKYIKSRHPFCWIQRVYGMQNEKARSHGHSCWKKLQNNALWPEIFALLWPCFSICFANISYRTFVCNSFLIPLSNQIQTFWDLRHIDGGHFSVTPHLTSLSFGYYFSVSRFAPLLELCHLSIVSVNVACKLESMAPASLVCYLQLFESLHNEAQNSHTFKVWLNENQS